MLAGQMILTLVVRPQGIASFWALLSFLGGARDKKLSLDPALKLNIVLWLTLLWRSAGYVSYSQILESPSKLLFLCTVTTKASMPYHPIMSSATAPSTLKSTVTSPAKHMRRRSFHSRIRHPVP